MATTMVLAQTNSLAGWGQDVDLKIKKTAEESPPNQSISFHAARRPIMVEVDLSVDAGAPQVPEGTLDNVIATLEANPKRLITLDFVGVPLRFVDLPRKTRDLLLQRGGPKISSRYDLHMVGELQELFESVRSRRSSAALSVKGLPWQENHPADHLSNERFEPVISMLDALVMRKTLVISHGGTDEWLNFKNAFSTAVSDSGGRAILFPANVGWRIAIDGLSTDPLERNGQTVSSQADQTPSEDELADVIATTTDSSIALGSPNSSSIDLAAATGSSSSSGDGGASGAVPDLASGGSSAGSNLNGAAPFGGGSGGSDGGVGMPPVEGSQENEGDSSGDDQEGAEDEEGEANEGESESEDGTTNEDSETDGSETEDSETDGSEDGDSEDGDSGDGDAEDPDGDAEDPDGDTEDPNGDTEDPDGDAEDPDGDTEDDGGWDPGDEIDPGDGSEEEDPEDDPDGGDAPDGGEDSDDADDPDDGGDAPGGEDGADDGDSSDDEPMGSDCWLEWDGTEYPEESGSFADLQALIDATPSGGTLDLSGLAFNYVEGDGLIVNNGKSLVIEGGRISAGKRFSWLSHGPGVFKTTVPGVTGQTTRRYLIDPDADDRPQMATWPEPQEAMKPYRFVQNPNWYPVINQTTGVTNGEVLTNLGSNVVGGKIRGFKITQASAIDAMDSHITSNTGVVIYQSANNIIDSTEIASWNPATGELLFGNEGLSFQGYMNFCISTPSMVTGGSGLYSFDPKTESLYYAPKDGNPNRVEVPAFGGMFRVAGGDITFRGVEMAGTTDGSCMSNKLSNPSFVTMDSCYVHDAFQAASGIQICRGTLIENMAKRGMTLFTGGIAERCHFINCEASSAITVMCSGGQPLQPVAQTRIINNFFSLPVCGHGQGISLYKDSWQNAVVDSNIFFNCRRAISFQPTNIMADLRTTPGEFYITNNLIIAESFPLVWGSGQAVVAFNSSRNDSHLGPDQLVEISNNTIYASEEILETSSVSVWSMTVSNLRYSTVMVHSNLVGVMGAATEGDGAIPHLHFGNQQFVAGAHGQAFAVVDLPNPFSVESVFNENSLQAQGIAATAAPDGGRIGARMPDEVNIEALKNRFIWEMPDLRIPTPPEPAMYGSVYGGQDLRP